MASTTALFTGLAGLAVNSRKLEVVGNNIANVNTTAYKSNRMLFASAFNRTVSLGSSPTANSGGTNPGQVGLGVSLAGTQRNFLNGAINPTGINTDLAIEGDGFFIVERNGSQLYTRAGSFQFNRENELVTLSGDRLQGYLVDDNFNLVDGQLQPLNIPVGTLTIAEATRNVSFSGNLNADGEVGTVGSLTTFAALTVGAAPAVAGDLLTAIDATPFAVDDVITVTGAERGGKVVPDAEFTVTAASTLQDYMDFLEDALGIVQDGGFDPADPSAPAGPLPGGATINAAGEIQLVGNVGTLNDIDLETGDLQITDSAGVPKANPFVTTKQNASNGEAVRTTFVVYDSLGTEMRVDLTMVLGARNGDGTFWRAFVHSADDTDTRLHLESGNTTPSFLVPEIQFDNFGRIVGAPQVNIELDRFQTGALDPLQIALQFESEGDEVSSLSDSGANSTIAAVFQDGSPLGVLSSFSVGDTGVITGGFTNGLTRDIGQVALAAFTNPEGLVDSGNNLYAAGPNSGTALVTSPLDFGTGRVIGGALELANVDLSQEFVDLIQTQTGYSAASRVISTTNELIQQLLVLGR